MEGYAGITFRDLLTQHAYDKYLSVGFWEKYFHKSLWE